MRKRQTFLLTILTPENEDSSFCGRLKVISSGKTSTFTCLDDLYRLIASEMDEDTQEQRLLTPLPKTGSTKRAGAS